MSSMDQGAKHAGGNPAPARSPVLLVGNFLSSAVAVRGVCEDLAARLPPAGWPVLTTSCKPERLPRLVDMVGTVWRRRHSYVVAHVDVYSGLAFWLADAVCRTLR